MQATTNAPVVQEQKRQEPLVREIVRGSELHEFQPIVNREVVLTEYEPVIQVSHEVVEEPARSVRETMQPIHRELTAIGGEVPVFRRLSASQQYMPVTKQVVEKPPLVKETVRRRQIQFVQPVIERERIQRTIVHVEKPVFERVLEAPVIRPTKRVDLGSSGQRVIYAQPQRTNLPQQQQFRGQQPQPQRQQQLGFFQQREQFERELPQYEPAYRYPPSGVEAEQQRYEQSYQYGGGYEQPPEYQRTQQEQAWQGQPYSRQQGQPQRQQRNVPHGWESEQPGVSSRTMGEQGSMQQGQGWSGRVVSEQGGMQKQTPVTMSMQTHQAGLQREQGFQETRTTGEQGYEPESSMQAEQRGYRSQQEPGFTF